MQALKVDFNTKTSIFRTMYQAGPTYVHVRGDLDQPVDIPPMYRGMERVVICFSPDLVKELSVTLDGISGIVSLPNHDSYRVNCPWSAVYAISCATAIRIDHEVAPPNFVSECAKAWARQEELKKRKKIKGF